MTDDVERYLSEDELRAENRRLSGVAIRYGDTAQSHRERFLPGSLRLDDQVILDWEHDQNRALAWSPGGGLSSWLTAPDAMRMTAELPPIPAADKALDEVRAGAATGVKSIRFRPVRDAHGERDSGSSKRRVLRGIAITRAPSYQDSRVEARSTKAPHMAVNL